MTTKWVRSLSIMAAAAWLHGPALAHDSQLTVEGLEFKDHVSAGMVEQDVYVEKAEGSGEVHRVTPDEREVYLDSPAYSTANPVHHDPFDSEHTGPFAKGTALGFTLGDWLAGRGTAAYACKGGKGTVKASFENLVPNGVYTMWHAIMAKAHAGCADCPFATLDTPVGASDGSQSPFVADEDGNATFEATFQPCLQLSGERLAAMLAIAYHSDGRTYGPSPGPMGSVAHVQLFTMLPEEGAWEVAAD